MNPNLPSNLPIFKNEPFIVLILAFLTCGLYLIYWNMKAAEVMNAMAGREVISPPVAIFAGCCSPLNMYYYYLAGKEGLPPIYRATEQQKDDSTMLMILGFFFPMVAAMIVQGDINKLYE